MRRSACDMNNDAVRPLIVFVVETNDRSVFSESIFFS